ncbi:hypothetical protein [Aquibacillus saliphilus]|uniref:hypothetical protein n=1 Tax=Aquibacillus saliphilus TaxID=1909422 RepID=UPI001CF02DD2|nr:hypothetical protein [Aquibacillus saliphilus]
MILPEHFDHNELFVLTALIISYLLLFFLPNRFPISMSLLIMLFTATVARLSDHLFSGPNLDLYNIMDMGTYELFDLFTYLLYAPFGYFLIYGYDKWKIKGSLILFYIIAWALLATIFEGVSSLFGVFVYKGWNLSYSFTYYMTMNSFMLLFYNFIKRKYEQSDTLIFNNNHS